MKLTQLIFTSFIATTAWADPNYPLAFFAQVGSEVLPLVHADYISKYEITPFKIGRSSNFPIEVTIKGKEAYTSKGKVGQYSDIFAQGKGVESLSFDEESTVDGFAKCSRQEYPPEIIFFGSEHASCSEVPIILMHFNPITGKPEGAPNGGEEDDHKGGHDEDDHKGGPDEDDHKSGPDEDDHKSGPDEDDHKSGPDEDDHKGGHDEDDHKGGPDEDDHKSGPDEDDHKAGHDEDDHKGGHDEDDHKGGHDEDDHKGGPDEGDDESMESSTVFSMSIPMESTEVAVPSTSIVSISQSMVSSVDPDVSSISASESSVPTIARSSESSIPTMVRSSESSVPTMVRSSESSVSTMARSSESSISTNVRSSESSVSTMARSSEPSIPTMARSSELPVPTMVKSSESSQASSVSRSSKVMSGVAEVSSMDKSSKWKAATITKKITSTTTICTECMSASPITVLKTYTDYVLYCPANSTQTISKCQKVCRPTTITATSATSLTITGVCIIPEIITGPVSAHQGAVETAHAGQYAPNRTGKSPSDAKGPAETANKGDFVPKGPSKSLSAIKPNPGSAGEKSTQIPKPKFANLDETTTQTLTATVTAPSVSSLVNGASKNAIGAGILGFVALFL